jgi:hypothetical protein
VQGRRELVFVGARARLDRIGHRRLGNRDRLDENLVRLVAERVAGERDVQLDRGAQIARVQLLHLDRLAPLHQVKVGQALRLAARVVLHRGAGLHHAADHLEEGDRPVNGSVMVL